MSQIKFKRYRRLFYAYWRLVRGLNLSVIAFTMIITRLYIVGKFYPIEIHELLFDIKFWSITVATVMVAAAGYVINDYYDIKIDLINKPGRVVLGRIIHRRTAILLHTTLNIIALLISILAGWKIVAVVAVSEFLLWYYANQLKRIALVGNITISALTGLTIYQWNLVYPTTSGIILTYALFAFIISLMREIVKDMEDMHGDQIHGCNTLPVEIGIRNTKYIVFGIVLGFGWYMIDAFFTINTILWWYFTVLLSPALLFWSFMLWKAQTPKDFGRLSAWSKVLMLIGVLSMMLL